MPLLLLGLAASGASWLRRGDEGLCSELLTIAFSSRVLSGALELAEGDLSEARGLLPVYMQMLGARRRRGEEDGRPSALRREATAGGGGSMLLPPDWLTAPLYRFEEGIGAVRLVTQVRATLWLLRALAERSVAAVSLVARSRLLCRGLAVFTLPDGTWREVRSELGALLEALMVGCGGGGGGAGGLISEERGVDVAALVEEVMNIYGAESYGDEVFTAWVLLGLRRREAPSVQQAVWAALEPLAGKIAVKAPAACAAWLGGGAGEEKEVEDEKHPLLDAWEASVLSGGLKEQEGGFLRRLALTWLTRAVRGGDEDLSERLRKGGVELEEEEGVVV